ncbi:uncharacterized protein LOC127723046 [Mytilus californianus]|uniref:uncharacterized protein LOC127723046 n=1 Tax=Mytilus californianus TaxID=6549 RepID=UPI00224769CF|nr:uncharacterized protein LOC127723046 [Mytilus californianus]
MLFTVKVMLILSLSTEYANTRSYSCGNNVLSLGDNKLISLEANQFSSTRNLKYLIEVKAGSCADFNKDTEITKFNTTDCQVITELNNSVLILCVKKKTNGKKRK